LKVKLKLEVILDPIRQSIAVAFDVEETHLFPYAHNQHILPLTHPQLLLIKSEYRVQEG